MKVCDVEGDMEAIFFFKMTQIILAKKFLQYLASNQEVENRIEKTRMLLTKQRSAVSLLFQI